MKNHKEKTVKPAAMLIPIFEDGREGVPSPYFTKRTQKEIENQLEHFKKMFHSKDVKIVHV